MVVEPVGRARDRVAQIYRQHTAAHRHEAAGRSPWGCGEVSLHQPTAAARRLTLVARLAAAVHPQCRLVVLRALVEPGRVLCEEASVRSARDDHRGNTTDPENDEVLEVRVGFWLWERVWNKCLRSQSKTKVGGSPPHPPPFFSACGAGPSDSWLPRPRKKTGFRVGRDNDSFWDERMGREWRRRFWAEEKTNFRVQAKR